MPETPLWPRGAPGSRQAVDAGCTCAVLDNAHGKGIYAAGNKHGWIVTGGCPVHTPDERDTDG